MTTDFYMGDIVIYLTKTMIMTSVNQSEFVSLSACVKYQKLSSNYDKRFNGKVLQVRASSIISDDYKYMNEKDYEDL